MKIKIDNTLKEYDVYVDTGISAAFTVIASNSEEARQIVSRAFGFDNGNHATSCLNRMHECRIMIGHISPASAMDEMDCTVSHSIEVSGPELDESNEERSSSVLIQAGDIYSTGTDDVVCDDEYHECEDCKDCEYRDHCNFYVACPLHENCSLPENMCLLYLLGQPAELIPMNSVKECAAELGNQLVHECIPDTALFITYNPCSVLDVEDARYLIAPALVYGLVDNKPAAMTDEECAAAQKLLADRTVTLTADGEEFHALKLFD